MSVVKEIPPSERVKCKQCSKGMSRDEHGNCEYCPAGTFQPNDLEDGGTGVVEC